MKLSFSSNAYTRHSVFTAVEGIAAAGYEGVELLADIPHLYPFSFGAKEVRQLQELLRHYGLAVANINANTAVGYYGRTFWEPLFEPSLANPDQVARKWRIDYTKKCIELGHLLGAGTVSVTSGCMLPGIWPEQSLELLRESLREIVSFAQQYHIRIGIEYEPGLLISCVEELVSFLGVFDSPLLGANLDLGHSHVLGEDHVEVISSLGEKIFHIHLEDISRRKHYHLIPGQGDMDFSSIFTALAKQQYKGYITVELYTYSNTPDDAARRSFSYLQGLPFWSDREKKQCA
ncbi:MAG: sugar phosphate isomerase/epimerase [Proteobacteria bacterium]|nr:sugar phosphate isomerase/epimerase [Pseudomonadota bacterium]MBU4295556.1 sugar phosphate isomerase/epimerase [Pseudomonadota bacterium]MCG2747675.1 sugar phosphate isomerase/epimerase [Desulfobulbaceae bacterium]